MRERPTFQLRTGADLELYCTLSLNIKTTRYTLTDSQLYPFPELQR